MYQREKRVKNLSYLTNNKNRCHSDNAQVYYPCAIENAWKPLNYSLGRHWGGMSLCRI
jgi:hypothetical protein